MVRSLVNRGAALGALALVTAAAGCALWVTAAGVPPAGATAGATTRSASPIPVGSSTQTITVGGVPRTYIVYRPAGLRARVPLVVMVHGGFGSAAQAQRSYHWDTQADTGHFIVAYPNGLHHAWNAGGGCCGQPAKDGTDDVGFITAMVAAVEHRAPIDPRRVYATGISNGGIMAYRLACTTDVFAAIGPDSATMLGGCPRPRPISVIAIHGTTDRRIPYYGGMGQGVAHIDGPAIPALNATWRATDHCAKPAISTRGMVKTSVARCPDGRAVELISIAGAGHQWPGGVDRPVIQKLLGLDPPSTALDATAVIWKFFRAHHR